MFLKRGQFSFVYHHSKVVALKVVIGNMFHVHVVEERPENSQKETGRFGRDGLVCSATRRFTPGRAETANNPISVTHIAQDLGRLRNHGANW